MASGLSLACTISMSTAAFAVNETNQKSVAELAEIESRREELYELLKLQLEAQDALEYMDQFSYLVEMTIEQEYYSDTDTNRALYYAENGGWVYSDNLNYTRECEYFNSEDTEGMYNTRYKPLDEIVDFLGAIGVGASWDIIKDDALRDENPSGGTAAEVYLTLGILALSLQDYVNDSMWEEIDLGSDGCVYNYVYDKMEEKPVVVLWLWDDEPYIDTSIFPGSETLIVKLR